jgi:hypothetical protein
MIVSHEVLITQLGGRSDFLCHTPSSAYSFSLSGFCFWDGFVSTSLCFLLLDWKVVVVFLILYRGLRDMDIACIAMKNRGVVEIIGC